MSIQILNDELINQILVTVFRPELPGTVCSHDVRVSPATDSTPRPAARGRVSVNGRTPQ